jgi:hypothetical protein
MPLGDGVWPALMQRNGITAVYRKLLHPCLPNLSLSPAPHGGHMSQAVWAADISAPCRRGWRKTNYAGWLPIGSWSALPSAPLLLGIPPIAVVLGELRSRRAAWFFQ